MQKREIWQVIVFGIITLGIYDLYWLAVTRQEMVQKGAQIPTLALPFAPLLGIIVVIILEMIGGSAVRSSDGGTAVVHSIAILVALLSVLAMIPLSIYWYYKYCKAVAVVTGGRTSFDFAFWIGILLHIFGAGLVWPALIQDSFNKLPSAAPAQN